MLNISVTDLYIFDLGFDFTMYQNEIQSLFYIIRTHFYYIISYCYTNIYFISKLITQSGGNR